MASLLIVAKWINVASLNEWGSGNREGVSYYFIPTGGQRCTLSVTTTDLLVSLRNLGFLVYSRSIVSISTESTNKMSFSLGTTTHVSQRKVRSNTKMRMGPVWDKMKDFSLIYNHLGCHLFFLIRKHSHIRVVIAPHLKSTADCCWVHHELRYSVFEDQRVKIS